FCIILQEKKIGKNNGGYFPLSSGLKSLNCLTITISKDLSVTLGLLLAVFKDCLLFLLPFFVTDTCSDRTPLHEAAYQGRLLHLMTLIAQGFQVNTLTLDGVSPLHEACLTGRYACAKVLLDNGANVRNAVSADGATPLFNSCSSGNVACVRLLLQHGASVHTDHQLASPIHQAAKNGHRECLELLLSSGAQIDLEIPGVGTPLYAACRAPSFSLCVHAGADVGSGCGQISPLHAAVCAGEADIVKFLLDFGADRASRNAEGKTPLNLSAPDSAVRFALERRAPCFLSELCRFCIRRSLGRPRLHRTSSLFLPHSIKNFLLHK
uniref:Ankyrin repeat and SOCS box protein 11 n=1 Tax=Xiphophorus maculatus TaxID=8083 RepID=A0A3B5Q917_XIPMA